MIDESVREACDTHEALRCIHVGFLCVQEAPADRPTMSSVISMLQGNEAASLPPSKEPAFSSAHRNSIAIAASPQTSPIFSNNYVITISSEAVADARWDKTPWNAGNLVVDSTSDPLAVS